jgi:HPt (histidine-containing phosphotransfer) domain-containing protein
MSIHEKDLGSVIRTLPETGTKSPLPELPQLDAAPKAERLLDSKEILARFGEDPALVVEVLGLFMETCPAMLEEIHEAIRGRNGSTLEVAAHSFRGAAGNFCIGNSVDLASRLESLGKGGKLADTPALGEALGQEMLQVTPLLQSFLKEMVTCASCTGQTFQAA